MCSACGSVDCEHGMKPLSVQDIDDEMVERAGTVFWQTLEKQGTPYVVAMRAALAAALGVEG